MILNQHILIGLMLFIFIIGILLNIACYNIYSWNKLKGSCATKKLHNYLTIIIIIGSIFMAIPIGYMLCHKNCNCNYDKGDTKNWIIYLLIICLVSLSIFLQVIISNLRTELSKCGNESNISSLLKWISIVQLIVIFMFSGIYIYLKVKNQKDQDKSSENDEDDNYYDDDDDDDDDDDEFSTKEELKKKKKKYKNKIIESLELDLTSQQASLEKVNHQLGKIQSVPKTKRNPKWKNTYNKTLSKQNTLENNIKNIQNKLENAMKERIKSPPQSLPSWMNVD
jgi:hypothetical protein